MSKYKGALELNWINKDKSLLYEIDEEYGVGIKPVWVEKDDIRVSEPRILKLKEEYGDLDNENMLIKGDNLLALKTLVEEFKNREEKDKVKCIYIDPPFNTGNAFENYDDNLEHSQWLTMMRDRIILLRMLMQDSGIFCCHVDNNEQPYLKVLLDEVFSRKNFISQITYERSGSAGIGQGGIFVNTAESILIYIKEKEKISINDVKTYYTLDQNTMKRYNKILTDTGQKYPILEFESRSNKLPVKIFVHKNFKIKSISLTNFKLRYNEIMSEYVNNFKNIFRTTNPQKENTFQNELISNMEKQNLYSVEYTPSHGKYKGLKTIRYYYNNELFAWLKDTAEIHEGLVTKSNKMTDIWVHGDIPKADLANEGAVKLKRGKKPEQLLKRIIELFSSEGDLILDSFLGSGTTAAVAHKMKRRWIGIEIGKQAETHCLKRLKAVVSGKDQTGISKEVAWSRGGGFRYYEVGESIVKDMDMNWDMTIEEMSRAVFMNFDYSIIEGDTHQLEADGDDFYLGRQKGGIAICLVTKGTKIIRRAELNKLVKDLSKKYPNQKVTIFTNMGVAVKPEESSDKLDVKKIPENILKKYRMV